MANIDLAGKKKELKERFDKAKSSALQEEKIILEHQKIRKSKIDEMSDLQAQFRLIRELEGKPKKK